MTCSVPSGDGVKKRKKTFCSQSFFVFYLNLGYKYSEPLRIGLYEKVFGVILLRPRRAEWAEVTSDTLALRDAYIDAGVLSEQWAADAFHVPWATVSECNLIVNWNF
jgi:hypothetical protein